MGTATIRPSNGREIASIHEPITKTVVSTADAHPAGAILLPEAESRPSEAEAEFTSRLIHKTEPSAKALPRQATDPPQ